MKSPAHRTRRNFLKDLGVGSAALPFLSGLTSLNALRADGQTPPKRLVIMFSPNGTLPNAFWPGEDAGEESPLSLQPILEPLAAHRDQMLSSSQGSSQQDPRRWGQPHARHVLAARCRRPNCCLAIFRVEAIPRPVGPAVFPLIRRSAIICRLARRPAHVLVLWSLGLPFPIVLIPGRGCATRAAINQGLP